MRSRQQALNLRHLAQAMVAEMPSPEATSARITFRALKNLQRSRPRLTQTLGFPGIASTVLRLDKAKLNLWSLLAQPNAKVRRDVVHQLNQTLQATAAWQKAVQDAQRCQEQLNQQPWNYAGRLQNTSDLLHSLTHELINQPSRPVMFWHHYDALGFLPQTWIEVFRSLKQRGWIVVVSSSHLNENALCTLASLECIVSLRRNLGLCLGAYRDFCCLLSEHNELSQQISTLILANDSTLPLSEGQPLVKQLETIAADLRSRNTAELQGLTDSVETGSYHIQTYFLAVNTALLRTPCWSEFWQTVQLNGDKDALIQNGEIGLTQWLLKQRIPLTVHYPLTDILLNNPEEPRELAENDDRRPTAINLTLMCWQGLLRANFPLIKKQLLLEPPELLRHTTALTQLKQHLNENDHHFRSDLQLLMRSRFFKA